MTTKVVFIGLRVIKRKQYAESLRDYVGDVVLVGISYNDKTKHHSCLIEHVDKYDDKLAGYDDKSPQCDDKRALILAYLAEHPHAKTQVIAEVIAVGESQTKVYLRELSVKGLVQPHGANKNRTYTLK